MVFESLQTGQKLLRYGHLNSNIVSETKKRADQREKKITMQQKWKKNVQEVRPFYSLKIDEYREMINHLEKRFNFKFKSFRIISNRLTVIEMWPFEIRVVYLNFTMARLVSQDNQNAVEN